MTKTKLLTYGAALALSLGATAANAAETECPAGPATDTLRIFVTDTDPAAQCWDYGPGNPGDAANPLVFTNTPTGDNGKFEVPVGYTLLDKSDQGGDPYEGLLTGTPVGLQTGLSGSFAIGLPSTFKYLIVFKSGSAGPNINPDWASFLLPLGVLSGDWEISGSQQLSHVELWGKNVVPLPAAAWLLGSGLLGLFAVGRRRKGAQVAAA